MKCQLRYRYRVQKVERRIKKYRYLYPWDCDTVNWYLVSYPRTESRNRNENIKIYLNPRDCDKVTTWNHTLTESKTLKKLNDEVIISYQVHKFFL